MTLLVPPPVPPVWARRLGYAGLLPFLGLALSVWFFKDELRLPLAHALLAYAATIASFLGAIHWGLAMRESQEADLSLPLFLWGVTPCLCAWVALLAPIGMGLWGMAVLLWACYGVDLRVYPRHGVQAWLPMRAVLTQVASVCCVIGALAL